MISAGSRDGRRMARLGLDVGGGSEMEMEDTELEEGEACSYRNNEQSNIDLDDLTYIDEKLQNVLGHFKKDFEGGVFTENLGAKYGGYGSFLIQRSPVHSYSRSPANIQNNQSHKSPTCLPPEGTNRSLLAQSNGQRSVNPESASINYSSSEPMRYGLAKQTARAPKNSTEKPAAKAEAVEKSANINEPRSLKVRIKVGSDNLSAKKKAAIYSGLGLISPSSSFDDSPTASEGQGDESPNQIIQIMTSLPIHGVQLLSPLPEALARLAEKILHDSTVHIKLEGKNQLPTKRKKDSLRAVNDDVIIKKQEEFGTQACDELVNEALKLPLLSDFHGTSKKKSNLQLNAARQNGDGHYAVKIAAREEKVDSLTNTGPSDFQKLNNGKKSMSTEQKGTKLPSGGKQFSNYNGSGQNNAFSNEKVESERSPKKKDLTKVKDKYKDFFGEMMEDSMDSPDTERPKSFQIDEKGSENDSSKQLMPKVNTKRVSDSATDENMEWVQCDECSKWRLLPFGTKGESFPGYWLCTMLDWLPGMNSCSIAEEETNKAVARLYPPKNHIILSDGNPRTAPNSIQPEQTLPIDLKEVPKLKNFSKDKSLIGAAGSPLDVETHAHHSRNSTDQVMESSQDKKRSKKKHPDKYSKGAHPKITKPESQVEPNQDCKKMKFEEEVLISSRDTDINQSSMDKSKFQAQASPHTDCIKAGNDNDISGVAKKRKVKSSLNENDETEQKKFARISTPEKKVSSSSRGNSRTDKKRKSTSAATSSSSKVSDSLRSKSILKDVKSSPVESVSSSPFRSLDSDNLKKVTEKNEILADIKADSHGERSIAMRKNLGGNNNHHDLKDSLVGEHVQIKQCESESSRSQSKNQKFKAESDKGKLKISDTCDDLQDHAHTLKEKTKDTKMKCEDKSGFDAVNQEPPVVKPSTENGEKRLKRFDEEKDEEMKGKEKAQTINYLAPKEQTPTKKSNNAKDRDAHNQAASNALKEATVLKHLADRKKKLGSAESTGLYFEAALKFLHGACLLELSGNENSKRGDVMQSMQVYRDTAKLCKFCAHQYEISKNLASAALAYKCVEVAYLRVIYSSHPAASRDRRELQTSLQTVPGESPSSSASDIDNASNLATAEKAAAQPAGNHVIAANNRPNFLSLLKYTQDVNYAMEASRKSQRAFTAAQTAMKQADGIAFLKKAVNFNFHDVDGLLRLVRLALDSIR